MMTPGESNGAGVWKSATLFLAGVVLTLSAAWITATHDAISRSEMNEIVRQLNQRMDEQVRSSSEHTERVEAEMRQIALDVARISERLGVPARPVTH
jgi:hypothetical protein